MCMCYLVYYFGLFLFLSNVALHDFFVSKNVYLYNFVFFFFFFFPLKTITGLNLSKLIFEYVLTILHMVHFDIFHAYKLFWTSLSCSFHRWYTEEKNFLRDL